MHRPGIEPGSVPWQGTILPLDHRCRRYPGLQGTAITSTQGSLWNLMTIRELLLNLFPLQNMQVYVPLPSVCLSSNPLGSCDGVHFFLVLGFENVDEVVGRH
jgi:hypothetical protein